MKPEPLAALNHLTIPFMADLLSSQHWMLLLGS